MSKVIWPDYGANLDYNPYEFDILGVWVAGEAFYLSTDSGCSCPMPWESHTEEDLTGPLTFAQMAEEARNLAAVSPNFEYAEQEVETLLKAVDGDIYNRR